MRGLEDSLRRDISDHHGPAPDVHDDDQLQNVQHYEPRRENQAHPWKNNTTPRHFRAKRGRGELKCYQYIRNIYPVLPSSAGVTYQTGTIRKIWLVTYMFVTTTGLQGLLLASELIIPVGGGKGVLGTCQFRSFFLRFPPLFFFNYHIFLFLSVPTTLEKNTWPKITPSFPHSPVNSPPPLVQGPQFPDPDCSLWQYRQSIYKRCVLVHVDSPN